MQSSLHRHSIRIEHLEVISDRRLQNISIWQDDDKFLLNDGVSYCTPSCITIKLEKCVSLRDS